MCKNIISYIYFYKHSQVLQASVLIIPYVPVIEDIQFSRSNEAVLSKNLLSFPPFR